MHFETLSRLHMRVSLCIARDEMPDSSAAFSGRQYSRFDTVASVADLLKRVQSGAAWHSITRDTDLPAHGSSNAVCSPQVAVALW